MSNPQVIAIFGAPRSGTSWLGQLFNSSPQVAYRFQPLFSFKFKGRLTESSSKNDIKTFYDDILNTDEGFVLQRTNISGATLPEFAKSEITHLVWKEVRYHYVIENLLVNSDTKIICIVRNPFAVISSWINAPKEFDSAWNVLEEWRWANKKNAGKREEYNGFEKWKELVFVFLKIKNAFPERVSIVQYEHLTNDPGSQTNALFSFSGIDWNKQTERFIQESTSRNSEDPYGVYKIKKNNETWRESLSPDIVRSIMEDSDFVSLQDVFKWEI
jgi:hypothetical protein